jgi:hypothetical protein
MGIGYVGRRSISHYTETCERRTQISHLIDTFLLEVSLEDLEVRDVLVLVLGLELDARHREIHCEYSLVTRLQRYRTSRIDIYGPYETHYSLKTVSAIWQKAAPEPHCSTLV